MNFLRSDQFCMRIHHPCIVQHVLFPNIISMDGSLQSEFSKDVETVNHDEESHLQMNKSQHHFLIAAWLVATFGQTFLRSRGGYVVDVAGGLGKLDYELAVRYGVPCVLIDPKFSEVVTSSEENDENELCGEEKPALSRAEDEGENQQPRRSTLQLSSMLRRKMKKLSRSRAPPPSSFPSPAQSSSAGENTGHAEEDRSPLAGLLRLSGLRVRDDGLVLPRVRSSIEDSSLLPFQHLPQPFPLSLSDHLPADARLLEVLAGASFIVGVHPDQVTESLVDAAVLLKIPFAVVPCCVFTKLFPARRTPAGEPVRTYEELVQYLKSKHKNVVQDTLPFLGRNIVLHCSTYD